MNEYPPQPQEHPLDFTLGQKVFKELEEFSNEVGTQDPRSESFKRAIERSKTDSLELVEEALDSMLGLNVKPEQKISESMPKNPIGEISLKSTDEKKKAEHKILSSLGVALEWYQIFGGKSKLPAKEKQLILRELGVQYGFQALKTYADALSSESLQHEEALQRAGLPPATNAVYMQEHLIKKLQQIPPELRENLFRPTK